MAADRQEPQPSLEAGSPDRSRARSGGGCGSRRHRPGQCRHLWQLLGREHAQELAPPRARNRLWEDTSPVAASAGPGMGIGFGFGGFGPVLHGEATVNGPNGYETIEVQTGTVTSVKDVSGSTWSLVVTSADKTALTYTVDSGTSVNGGESGIASVKSGNKVSIVAVVSKGTATVKTLMDTTTLQANRGSWAPMPQGPPTPPSSGSSTS